MPAREIGNHDVLVIPVDRFQRGFHYIAAPQDLAAVPVQDHDAVVTFLLRRQDVANIGARREKMGGMGRAQMLPGTGNAALSVKHPHLSRRPADYEKVAAMLLRNDDLIRIQGIFVRGVRPSQLPIAETHVARSVRPQHMLIEQGQHRMQRLASSSRSSFDALVLP